MNSLMSYGSDDDLDESGDEGYEMVSKIIISHFCLYWSSHILAFRVQYFYFTFNDLF